ncbi:prolyl oligopeptidase family serine peptidase [Luteimonas composti]|uniref:Prolyl oligopeptidase family serine peptidase n=1 Tax=Luteimonas composti TaxID=398257 RepID=A0ABT6MPG9_9GAMM|nr:prolyl oligopeptidase family serine peptidase [Luteimonas composti]MDH7452483.1 prolyl oligopeptidase family serine peptidase [Luteimonas composti]
MKHILVALSFAAAAATGPLQAATPATPTVEQLGAFPAFSSFTMSPDGKHIAALRAEGEDRYIAVWRSDALDQAPTLIGSDKMKFTGVSFIKNDRLAVSLWQPFDLRGERVVKTFLSKLMITDLAGKQWKEPLPLPRPRSREEELAQSRTSPTVLDSLPNDPHHILVINNIGSSGGDVFRVDLRNMSSSRIQMTGEDVAGYVTDLAGELRARLQTRTDSTGAYIAAEFRNPQSGTWEEHFRSYVKNRDQTQIVGFGSDPNIAFIQSNEGQDKSSIFEYDIAAKKRKEVLFQHAFFNAGRVIVNPYLSAGEGFGEILGLGYEGPRGDDVEWVSPRMRALDAGLRQALGIRLQRTELVDPATGSRASVEYPVEKSYRVIDFTPDLSTMLLSVDGASHPPEYYLFRNGSLSLLAKSYPQIDTAALGRTELVYYPARDGLQVPAFLTRPDGELCGAGPWPAVVHPHGGPWSRDTMDFDGSMWVPLMASRCMAVLRPQFRGSDGWGRKLWMAGDMEWGQKMQDDKDDGAKWLIDQGIAAPGRIAMFGFSYGGYSAFAASVRPNGIYKCAIAGAGVTDINRIWARFYSNPFFRQAQAHTVKGLSPLDRAGDIKIPLMVYHGVRDQTVPVEQSQWFVSRAKSAAHPVVYHEIEDYGHGPAWTRGIMTRQLGLIEDYLVNDCGGGGL